MTHNNPKLAKGDNLYKSGYFVDISEEQLLSSRFVNDGNNETPLTAVQLMARDSLVQKLNTGHYKTEAIDCVCGGTSFTTIAKKDRYGLGVNTAICKSCGLILTNPRMNQAAYNEFYDIEYRPLYTGAEIPDKEFFDNQVLTGRVIFSLFANRLGLIKNVLEIGCGAGGILLPFHEHGLNVMGIDLGSKYLDYGRTKGLNLINASSEDLLSDYSGGFDLIILSHVAEHFLDLQREFSCIKRLLRESGLVFISLPGVKGIKNYGYNYLAYFQNAHTYHFTKDSLTQVMRWMGFDFVYADEEVTGVFINTPRDFSVGNITNLYSNNLTYMQTVEYLYQTMLLNKL